MQKELASEDQSPSRPAIQNRGLHRWLWAALFVAFSPTWIDLLRHLAAEPTARYVVIFPLLFIGIVNREPQAPTARGLGFALVAAGLMIEMLAILANEVRFARPGLIAAAIGIAFVGGTSSRRASLLLAFTLPVPTAIQRKLSPTLESAHLDALAPLVPPDVLLSVEGSHVGALALGPPDGGLPLCALTAGLAFALAVWRGRPIFVAATSAAVAGLAGLPLQFLVLAAALTVLAAGSSDGARFILDWAWLMVCLGAFAVLALYSRTREPALA